MRRLPPCSRIVLVLLLFLAATLVIFSAGNAGSFDVTALWRNGSAGLNSRTALPELRYISDRVVRTWGERSYLVVFGVASIVSMGRARRQGQRRTCWSYSDVARRANNFTGPLLMLYTVGWHPSQDDTDALLAEAAEWQDMVAISLQEAQSIFYRRINRPDRVEVLMSYKTVMWYDLAVQVFPRTPYIVKADDDIILKVPQYLADLRTLPRNRLFWGRILSDFWSPSSPHTEFPFVVGYCSTMSRDVAEQVASHEPLRRLVFSHPYNESRMSEYKGLIMQHEDKMVGYVLQQRGYPLTLVTEKVCRVHYKRETRKRKKKLLPSSVVVHYVKKPLEFNYYFSRMLAANATPKPFRQRSHPAGFRGKDVYEFDC